MRHEAGETPTTYFPEHIDDVTVRIDTHSLRFDHILGRIHGAEQYFETHPGHNAFIYRADVTGDQRQHEDHTFRVRRDRLHFLKLAALGVYETLRDEGPLGKEIAGDIMQSWKKPEDYVVFEDRRLPY